MKLANKIIPAGPIGQEHCILSGKPTDNPRVSVYLLNTMDQKPNYSLWNVEISDDEKTIELWPYEGEDYEDLKRQLLETFIKNTRV